MACPTESKECGDFGGPVQPNIDDDLKYMVIQLCEEVNFLRMTKKESEERMRHLVIEQHKHERQLEEEILKNSILRDKHEQKLLDLDRSYQDDIKRLNREKSKLVWENESWEKDVKSVKDEVRSLQLEKYNLERIIREQSHLLKTQTAAGESCIKQASIFEEQFKDIKQSLEKCNTQVLILSKEVKEATVLNERLSFINTHNECMKRKLESKLDEKERIISELTVKTKLKETTSGIKPLEIGAIGFLDKEELKQLKRNEELLKKQLESSHERSKEIRKQLDEAQVLIDKYVTIHVKYKDIVEVMEGEKKEMIEKMLKLENDRSTEEKVVKNLEEEMDQLKVKWNDKEKSLALAVSEQSRNVEALTEENNKLEEKNASLEEAYRGILVKMKLHEKQFNENAKNKVDVGINTTIDKFPIEKANMSNCSVQTIDNGAFISSSIDMKSKGTQYSQDDMCGSNEDKFDLSLLDQANLCSTSINKRQKVE
ncbi:hypothetical protein BSL78_27389 [Apostichopus japonicus]|uniref:Coiled-coil domain-containing protein n=1 Tax=Stichopus japonicus TaxID=307972 RepID=A0A2G8JJ65_STIJA|nr:hypothetical protein BSL78_27389 [Apostichopus japonicus]